MLSEKEMEFIQRWADAVVAHYEDAQKIIAIEEMGELIQAITKDIRGKTDINNLAEEIGDVILTVSQLILLYSQNDDGFEKAVERSMNQKMLRTIRKMSKEEEQWLN